EVCEQIAATTKLEKERILSEYLRTHNDKDLAIACTFLSGSPFALRDQRTLNTGFAAIRDALIELHPEVEASLGKAVLKTGDPGEAIERLLAERKPAPGVSLQETLSYYEKLTIAVTNQEKRRLTADIFARATPIQIKYIVKILLGGMRIGLQESLVESSIAKAFSQPLVQVQKANMLLGDIGEKALLARQGKLGQAKMRLLH